MYTKTLDSLRIPTALLRVWPDPDDKTVAHSLHTGTKKQKQNIIWSATKNLTSARALKPLNTKNSTAYI